MSEANPKPSSPTPVESSGLHLNQVVATLTTESAEPLSITTTTEFVRKAVAEQPAEDVARLILPKDAGLISAETLLAIVSYCYAKGIYSCRDIELAVLRDAELRASLGNSLPSDACLRRFRRLNRTAIQTVLEKTFIQAQHELGCIPSDYPASAEAPSSKVSCGPSPRGSQNSEVSTSPSSAGSQLPNSSSSEPSTQAEGQTTFLARQAAADRLQKALFVDGMTRDA